MCSSLLHYAIHPGSLGQVPVAGGRRTEALAAAAVQLKEAVQAASGLSSRVALERRNMSVNQRQLICLAWCL
jgi:hypothetical protein